jgi:hypothetical protein
MGEIRRLHREWEAVEGEVSNVNQAKALLDTHSAQCTIAEREAQQVALMCPDP